MPLHQASSSQRIGYSPNTIDHCMSGLGQVLTSLSEAEFIHIAPDFLRLMHISYLPHINLTIKFDKYDFNSLQNSLNNKKMTKERKENKKTLWCYFPG